MRIPLCCPVDRSLLCDTRGYLLFSRAITFFLYLYWTGQWEYADVVFVSLGIVAAFDAFSIARRGYGII